MKFKVMDKVNATNEDCNWGSGVIIGSESSDKTNWYAVRLDGLKYVVPFLESHLQLVEESKQQLEQSKSCIEPQDEYDRRFEELKNKYSSETKSSSPKELPPAPRKGVKHDYGKPMWDLLPADALEEVAKVFTAGALKYNEPVGEENWRKLENPQSRLFSAAQRHLWADKRGEYIDVDTVINGVVSEGTNCYHLACAISGLMMKLQLRIEEERNKRGEDKNRGLGD